MRQEGKRKKYDLDRVVHSQSETSWELVSISLSAQLVSARSAVPREVKVEISEARVGRFQSGGSRAVFL